jgi:hypothetical protein
MNLNKYFVVFEIQTEKVFVRKSAIVELNPLTATTDTLKRMKEDVKKSYGDLDVAVEIVTLNRL